MSVSIVQTVGDGRLNHGGRIYFPVDAWAEEDKMTLYCFREARYVYGVPAFHGNRLKKMDALDRIRVAMIRNREKPEYIRRVTKDYWDMRQACGYPTV